MFTVVASLLHHLYIISIQKAAKRDATLEQQARDWMEAVVEEPYPPGSYEEGIKDGVYLCK